MGRAAAPASALGPLAAPNRHVPASRPPRRRGSRSPRRGRAAAPASGSLPSSAALIARAGSAGVALPARVLYAVRSQRAFAPRGSWTRCCPVADGSHSSGCCSRGSSSSTSTSCE